MYHKQQREKEETQLKRSKLRYQDIQRLIPRFHSEMSGVSFQLFVLFQCIKLYVQMYKLHVRKMGKFSYMHDDKSKSLLPIMMNMKT